MLTLAAFTGIDWCVLGGYLALVSLVGFLASRKAGGTEGYFLAGRTMPAWAVAMSMVATTLSVATFTGAPQESFKGNLTYLSLSLGGFVAAFIVAGVFLPRLYRAGTITIYGYIDQRFGATAKTAMSMMFLFGRLLASGARLFIAGIPVCLLLFGEASPSSVLLIFAILLIGAIGTAYTVSGGIRAVIWTDTMQVILVVGAAVASIALLLHRIPLPLEGILAALNDPAAGPGGHGKLRVIETAFEAPYSVWAAVIGNAVFMVAAYGCDHDLAQRLLTAKSPARGAVSLIASQALSMGVVCLFLVLGLLLFIFYRRPDLMGAAAPGDVIAASHEVYPQFLLNHMPIGLAGLAMAGMFAAAQGSLDSAINAMASSAVADLYLPLRRRLGHAVDERADSAAPRLAVILVGAALIGFAIAASMLFDPKESTLIQFALGVMSFAYSGMLGVFLTALFTRRRGSTASILAALATGVAVTALLQKGVLAWWSSALLGAPLRIGFLWWIPIGATASCLVCLIGRDRPRSHPVS